jgi:hypothetical protein
MSTTAKTIKASENQEQRGRMTAHNRSAAAGVKAARHNTAKHNKATQFREDITIPSYSKR